MSKINLIKLSNGENLICNVVTDTDKHIEITNRYLNWPEKNCYDKDDIRMIIEGPENE